MFFFYPDKAVLIDPTGSSEPENQALGQSVEIVKQSQKLKRLICNLTSEFYTPSVKNKLSTLKSSSFGVAIVLLGLDLGGGVECTWQQHYKEDHRLKAKLSTYT